MTSSEPDLPQIENKYDYNSSAAKNFRARFKKKFDAKFESLGISNYESIPQFLIEIAIFYTTYHKSSVSLENFINLGVPRGGLSKAGFQTHVASKLDLVQNLVEFFAESKSNCKSCRISTYCQTAGTVFHFASNWSFPPIYHRQN